MCKRPKLSGYVGFVALLVLLLPSCKTGKEQPAETSDNPIIVKAAGARLDEIRTMMRANENTSVKCAGAMSYAENLEHERSAQAAMLRTAIARTCGYDAPLAGILRDFEK